MTIRKIFFEAICGVILVAMAGGPVYAGQGDPVREGKEVTYGINIGSGAYLDDANVTDGNIPYMQAAGAGFGDSPLSRTAADAVTMTGTFTSTVGVTTPAITAPAASLVIKPTTDAVNAVQVQDVDGGTPVLNIDTDNERVGIGTSAPESNLHVYASTSSELKIESDGAGSDLAGLNLENNDAVDMFIRLYGSAFVDNVFGNPRNNFGVMIVDGANAEGLMLGNIGAKPIIFGVSNSEKMRVHTTGNLGIGTTTPDTLLELSKASADTEATISTYHDTEATSPVVTLRKADGTEATPTAVDDNAVLGTHKFEGYDFDSWALGGYIQARVDGTPGDGDMPCEIAIATSADGSESPTERVTIGPTGSMTLLNALIATPETVTCVTEAGTASVVKIVSLIVTDGDADTDEDTVSLANGTAGQIKIFVYQTETDVGDTANVTPATALGFTKIVFDTPGESCTMVYTSSGWAIVSNNGGVIS